MLMSSYAETFPGRPDQVALARNHVRDYLITCPAADDVVFIVSEFAANAVLHSLSRVGTFGVIVQIYPGYIYAEVEDEGGPWYCPAQDGRPHGLELVTLLTRRDWGTDPAGNGHRAVWARIPHPCCGTQAAQLAGLPERRRTEAGSPPVPPSGVPSSFLLLNEPEDS